LACRQPGADSLNRIVSSRGMPSRLLVLRNGHGEGQIPAPDRALTAAPARTSRVLWFLPLVGEGSAFKAAEARRELKRIGPRLALPSGVIRQTQSLPGLLGDLAPACPCFEFGAATDPAPLGASRPARARSSAILLPSALLAFASVAPYGLRRQPEERLHCAAGLATTWPADRYQPLQGANGTHGEWALMGRVAAGVCGCQGRTETAGASGAMACGPWHRAIQ